MQERGQEGLHGGWLYALMSRCIRLRPVCLGWFWLMGHSSAMESYRVTLKACEDQPEAGERLLSACHQRCADRYEPISTSGVRCKMHVLKLVPGRTGHTQSWRRMARYSLSWGNTYQLWGIFCPRSGLSVPPLTLALNCLQD